jgi:ABC-2 type transport system ATP-binding protein
MTADVNTPDPTGDMIATRALSKRYGSTAALSDVDIRVPTGAVYMLVGENGAGKSTLLRCLQNLEKADAGTITVADLDPRRSGARVRARTGYVPEHSAIRAHRTTIGQWFAERAVYYPEWDAAYAAALCLQLRIDTTRRVDALSKGQTRAVQLVAAIAFRPAVLLLDEPTDGLDPVARDAFLGLLSGHLADTGCAVLLSTHLIHEVDPLVDHVGVLSKGRLVAQGTREDLRQSVKQYCATGPEGWDGPADLPGILRKERLGREIQWVLRGDQPDVVRRIAASGGEIRDVTSLSLNDVIVNMMREKPRS